MPTVAFERDDDPPRMQRRRTNCCSRALARVGHWFRMGLREMTIEPMVLLFAIGFGSFGAHVPVNKQRKFAQFFNESLARLDAHGKEVLLQQKLTEWSIYEMAISRPMVIFIGLFLGSYSDIHGRKPVLLLGTASAVVYIMCQIVFYSDAISVPIYWIIIQAIIYNALGGSSAHHISSAYLVDVSSNSENLSIRLTLLVVLSTAGSFFSNNVVNQLFPHLHIHISLEYLLTFAQICCCIAFFYVLFFVRHVLPKEQQQKISAVVAVVADEDDEEEAKCFRETPPDTPDPTTAPPTTALPATPEKASVLAIARQKLSEFITMEKNALKVIFKKREGYKRAFLMCVVAVEALSGIAEKQESELLKIYTLREPLNWKAKEMALYFNFSLIAVSVGTTVGMIVFKKILHLRDTTVILIALATNIADVAVIAFATESWMLYAGTLLLDGLAYTAVPAYETFLASLVPRDEIGKIYAFLVVVHNLTTVAQLLVLQPLYIVTVGVFPQLLWLCLAGFSLIATSIMVWVHIRYTSEMKSGRIHLFTATEAVERRARKITEARGGVGVVGADGGVEMTALLSSKRRRNSSAAHAVEDPPPSTK